jgi:HAD superfamily hydrolase (TIGR01450 family)
MAWVIDLDGVVWLAEQAIDGAAEAVAELRSRGTPLAFVTNNSYPTRAVIAAKLASFGIDPGDDVVTSAMAAATLVEPGTTVLVCGGPGVREEVESRGARIVDDAGGTVDAVVVGFDPEFDYARMTAAATAVRNGARLIATNDDATYPTPNGPTPGAGAIVASIVKATGVDATVAGKPHGPMIALVRARLGTDGVVVGDRPDTDGRFAVALGYRYALVLSGVTAKSDLPADPVAVVVAADLLEVVRTLDPA